MCHTHATFCPIHCIVPPYMVEHMLRTDDPNIRETAMDLLAESARIRGQREILGAMRAPLGSGASATGRKRRFVFDARQTTQLPGILVREEGGAPTGDVAVDEAYDGLGHTYDFFWEEFERDSIDGRGMALEATVHYARRFNNAFWNGRQMVFGDGDGVLFKRFTIALDIIGHELAHGVTEHTAGLVYQAQPGALNEHFSDVFGVLIKQRTLEQVAADADWLVGEGLFTPAVQGKALRSMVEPGTAYDDPMIGKDPQPGHMRDYVETSADNGGVHINSGIPNRAFVIAAKAIGGNAWEDAGQIWYNTLLRLNEMSNFDEMVTVSLDVAAAQFGPCSDQFGAVEEAWREVGLLRKRKTASRTSSRVVRQRSAPAVDVAASRFDEQIDRIAERLGNRLIEVLAAKGNGK